MKQNTKWPASTQGLNLFSLDTNLHRFLSRPGLLGLPQGLTGGFNQASGLTGVLKDFGEWAANQLEAQASFSDRHAPPNLVYKLAEAGIPGDRIPTIVFNPHYEEAQRDVYQRGAIGYAYNDSGDWPKTHMMSFVMGYLTSKNDISTHCPLTLSGAVAYVLNKYAPEDIRQRWMPELTRMDGAAKTGGTWVTEKHSGTNAGADVCVAKRRQDGTFSLSGQKWFVSNAASSVALALARPEGAPDGNKGLGLYLVPDKIEGQQNSYRITTLKEKLGTRGLATVELDLNGCTAYEIVPPPYGLKAMMEALLYSRVHNSMAAAGVTHRAYIEALCWTENRTPFGKPLIEEPMIQKKLMDMATEWMASSALAFESARSFCASEEKRQDGIMDREGWMRMITAAAKWRTAESAVQSAKTLVELIGGNGYTTDFVAERLYRDALVLSVWEGPEQIQAREQVRVFLRFAKQGDILNQTIGALCDSLPDSVSDLRRAISRELRDLQSNFRSLQQEPNLESEIADDLLHHFADLSALALLAHEAAYELSSYNDSTKLYAARRFHEKQFGPRHSCKIVRGEEMTFFKLVSTRPRPS